MPLQPLEETRLDQAFQVRPAAHGGLTLEQGKSKKRKEQQRGTVMD